MRAPRRRSCSAPTRAASEKQAAVSRLIQVYSLRGHQIADLDPLGLWERPVPTVLSFDFLGLDDSDLSREFYTGGLGGTGQQRMKLQDILALLKRIYCGKLAAEFAHISRARERLWLREQFETCRVHWEFSPRPSRRRFLDSLTRAEGIERYLNTRFVGQKRFSLEGSETLIPMLDDLIQRAGEQGVQEIVIGMAHRGRLNVLVNVLGKSPTDLFSEFEGAYDLARLKGSGDVKYHKGYSADVRTPSGNVHVALAFNPSHLEIVNPVVEGSVRARQDRRGDSLGEKVLPVLIHGDAAFAGQGVVAETFQLSQTRAFYTGGTVHLVINNQIGFTTSDPRDSRSTTYCSDVAKMVEAPVFHVNGDDPEAAVAAIRLALRYRQVFHKDVVIDLVAYRRLGHNEADEPAATQPVMYNAIREHPSVRTLYGRKLAEAGSRHGGRNRAARRGLSQGARRGPQPEPGRARHDRQPVHRRLEPLHAGRARRFGRNGLARGRDPQARRAREHGARGLEAAPARAEDRRRPAQDGSGRESAATGVSPRRWLTPRCCPRTSTCGSSAKTAAAARSSIGMRL